MTATIAVTSLLAVFAAVIYAIHNGYDVKAVLKLLFIALTFEAKDNRHEREQKELTRDPTQNSSSGDQPTVRT